MNQIRNKIPLNNNSNAANKLILLSNNPVTNQVTSKATNNFIQKKRN